VKFPLAHFLRFARALRVDTKERGIVRLGDNLLGTQTWVLREIVKGLENGQHEFDVLKCRQIGISTIMLALDLYWLFSHRGMTGSLVTHDEPARDQFRATLQMYYDGLDSDWKQPIAQNNRNQLVLRTGTRMSYRVAGTRGKGGNSLGRSAALSFLHATEIAYWGDPDGLSSLRSSLAEKNPHRLYVWESTANGFNHWYDMWIDSKSSVTQRPIFVSWWANELYRAERGGAVWQSYWGKTGRPTQAEKTYARDIRKLYGVSLDDEQFAWYRWLAAEKVTDELDRMEEFPHTEFDAFIASGSQFFSAQAIGNAVKTTREIEGTCYRLQTGQDVRQTNLMPLQTAGARRSANLWIYEEPDKAGVYVVGGDPSFGSSENANQSVASVWRCYGDRIVQVAEFVDTTIPTYAFAWVMVYLAGAYGSRSNGGGTSMLNLEINGPGQAVLNEIQNLKRQRWQEAGKGDRSLADVMGNMSEYLWRKYDSLYGSMSSIHTMTTFQVKERMLNTLRDYFERGMLVPRSEGLVEEMKSVVREDGSAPAAPDGQPDDRVIAAALAVLAWNDQLRQHLLNRGFNYDFVHKEVKTKMEEPVARTVQRFMQEIGYLKPVEVNRRSTGVGRYKRA
jgi:hypothetical protein